MEERRALSERANPRDAGRSRDSVSPELEDDAASKASTKDSPAVSTLRPASQSTPRVSRVTAAAAIAQAPVPPSPLSTASTSSRKREGSVSSTISSSTTDPTSADDTGSETTPVPQRPRPADKQQSPDSPRAALKANIFQPRVAHSMLSLNDLTSTTTGPPTSGAINIPTSTPFSSGLVVSPSSSARLSTTPLFPSPLAQASRPDEDNDAADGDDEDADSDEEAKDHSGALQSKPSDRHSNANPAFSELDMLSPDDFDSSASGSADQTARDSSNVTTRSFKLRSPNRASGLPGAPLALSAHARRRSRSGESDSLSSFRSSSSLSPPSLPSSPVSGLHQRRQSTPYSSPSKPTWPASGPSSQRTGRSSISGNPGQSVLVPVPMAPPPSESIRLQKVPDSVRSAVEIRSLGSSTSSSSAAFSPSLKPTAGAPIKSEQIAPKTPVATRLPTPNNSSPASGSGTPPSGAASRPASPIHSANSSRRPSADTSMIDHLRPIATPSMSSASAFGPLFSMPVSPSVTSPSSGHARERSLSNFWGANFGATSDSQHNLDRMTELGVSPRASMYLPDQSSRNTDFLSGSVRSTMMRSASGRRTSVAPSVATSPVENTDQYAQILRDSRIAKVKQWRPATGDSIGQPTTPTSENAPTEDADIALGTGQFAAAEHEVEWVDWLEEYERMKQAKLELEQQVGGTAASGPLRRQSSHQSDPGMWPLDGLSTQDEGQAPTTSIDFSGSAPRAYFPLVNSQSRAPGPIATSQPIASEYSSSLKSDVPGSSMTMTTSQSQKPVRQPFPRHQSDFARGEAPGKRHRKTASKLGLKIDTWWNAVRSSFAGTPADERPPSSRLLSPNLASTALPAAPRTSSQFARPEPVMTKERMLRPVASAQDLSAATPRSEVPTGALAPAARTMTSVSPRSATFNEESPARWRNPNLSLDLNLGPAFGSSPPFRQRDQQRSNSVPPPQNPPVSQPSTSASKTAPLLSPMPTTSSTSNMQSPSYFRTPFATTSPAGSGSPAIWDRTPGLIPVSTAGGHRPPPELLPDPDVAAVPAQLAFSMQTVHMQVRRRLGLAKENCDKELRKIVAGITEYVESELHAEHVSPPASAAAGHFGDLADDSDYGRSPGDLTEAETESAPTTSPQPGGTPLISRPTSRAAFENVSPSLSEVGAEKSSLARRVSSRTRIRSSSVHSRSADGRRSASGRQPALDRKSVSRGPGSRSSSKSRSRPGSPFIPSDTSTSRPDRVLSPADSEAASQASLIALLQDLIGIATEILDTPINTLTSKPGMCADYVHRVQEIGHAWDEKSDLPCRGYYVQLLLAVAGLTRVIEWWEGEQGFWSFDEGDDKDDEPILFVAKRAEDNDEDGRISPLPDRQVGEDGSGPQLKAPSGSPLGIDLGSPAQSPEEPRGLPTVESQPESPPGSPQQDLREMVEQVRSQTLRMELSLNEQNLLYVSSAWEDLVGLTMEDCLNAPVADFLYPDDAAVFAEATRQLEADDSHTVEVRFRLHVGSSSVSSSAEGSGDDLYEVMEGKGMLMHDSLNGRPSHTMWVVRPCSDALPAADVDSTQVLNRPAADSLLLALEQRPSLASESILCRICERPSPAWFFEKHSETCNETHRLESDINDGNDRLRELLKTITSLINKLDESDGSALDYEGVPLLTSLGGTAPTYLEGIRSPLLPRSSSSQLRRSQQAVLEELRDITETALSISSPMLSEEQLEIPLQEQRLLSPNSEQKLAVILQWERPAVEEPALSRLVSDVDEQVRFKFNSVTRLRNTILYAEKIRIEWEIKATELLNKAAAGAKRASPFDSPQLQPLPPEPSPLAKDRLELPANAQMVPTAFLSPNDPHRSSLLTSPISASQTLSPRLPSGALTQRSKESSIKDFKFIKAISKGAFGSVLLAKKISTGDYYAVKILKKSDMISKNQVTNVKAERMILMNQTKSDFVVKLYYTFMNEDYLFLVMEYLNGGDCAALVKNLGGLPEDWARNYIAEVTLGLQDLHDSGIVHRDLKPDNLLIDAKGHLKLTDFGLSRIGVLGRQSRYTAPGPSKGKAAAGTGRSSPRNSSPLSTPAFALGPSQSSYFGSLQVSDSFNLDSPDSSSASGSAARQGHSPALTDRAKQFVGTPDYLAPESILGLGMDATVDWWALGVICYEFLYGFPPFHDSTPEKVFENILSRRFDWHEDEMDISPEAKDFIDRLLCVDVKRRLGARGAEEVKAHPFLRDIDWANLLTGEVSFVPQTNDPEDTQYFDPRGATQIFDSTLARAADEEVGLARLQSKLGTDNRPDATQPKATQAEPRRTRNRTETEPSSAADDFGAFTFRNLHVLKQANDDMIRKLRSESLLPLQTDSLDRTAATDTPQSTKPSLASSPSSSTSESVQTRTSQPPTPLMSSVQHSRTPSEQFARPRARQTSMASSNASDHIRRASITTRARAQSMSETDRPSNLSDFGHRQRARRTSMLPQSQQPSASELGAPSGSERSPSLDRGLAPLSIPSTGAAASSHSPSSVSAPRSMPLSNMMSSANVGTTSAAGGAAARKQKIDCLIAGRNPIANKVLDTLLTRLGCRCVVVQNGEDAIFAAAGVKFDIIWMDIQLPIVNGEQAARMIKSTKNPSCESPIVAVCSDQGGILDEVGTLFSAVLAKPVMKAQVLDIFAKLGYEQKKTTGAAAGAASTTGGGESQSRRGSGDQPGGATGSATRSDTAPTARQRDGSSSSSSFVSYSMRSPPAPASPSLASLGLAGGGSNRPDFRRHSSLASFESSSSSSFYHHQQQQQPYHFAQQTGSLGGGGSSNNSSSGAGGAAATARSHHLGVIQSSNVTTVGQNSPAGSEGMGGRSSSSGGHVGPSTRRGSAS